MGLSVLDIQSYNPIIIKITITNVSNHLRFYEPKIALSWGNLPIIFSRIVRLLNGRKLYPSRLMMYVPGFTPVLYIRFKAVYADERFLNNLKWTLNNLSYFWFCRIAKAPFFHYIKASSPYKWKKMALFD